jgi:hypothetical protein
MDLHRLMRNIRQNNFNEFHFLHKLKIHDKKDSDERQITLILLTLQLSGGYFVELNFKKVRDIHINVSEEELLEGKYIHQLMIRENRLGESRSLEVKTARGNVYFRCESFNVVRFGIYDETGFCSMTLDDGPEVSFW